MSKSTTKAANKMTKADAARIQSAYAKAHNGRVPANTFQARAQSAADRNAAAAKPAQAPTKPT
jgi:hypothetical protein